MLNRGKDEYLEIRSDLTLGFGNGSSPSDRLLSPRRSGAAILRADIVARAKHTQRPLRHLSHALQDELADHRDKPRIASGGSRPVERQAARFGRRARFGIQIVDHFHVIGHKPDGHNDYRAACDLTTSGGRER